MEISGARLLITGGAAGIGLAIAKAAIAAKARVHICDVSREAVEQLAKTLPSVSSSCADVASEADVDRLFADVDQRLGGLDFLINNAGIAGPTANVESTSLDDWQRTLAVNLTGAFLCTRRAVPRLTSAGGGGIVNMASVAARLGFPSRSAYSAAKWGLIGLTQTWAMELGPRGIRVNAILPGIVSGDRQERVLRARAELEGISYEELESRRLGAVSLRSWTDPQDIAEAVLFLCSPAGRMISGQSLGVCGNLETLR